MAKELKVILKKSPIGRPEKQRKVLVSLKLTKMNRAVQFKDSPELRGKINTSKIFLLIKDNLSCKYFKHMLYKSLYLKSGM